MFFFVIQSTIRGRIDEVNQVLELESRAQVDVARCNAMQKWTDQLANLHNAIIAKLVQ
jgi:COP9 signalosome complex subunit 2